MALTLTANIDADDLTFRVSGTVPVDIGPGYLFRIGDEVFRLKGFEGVVPPYPQPVNRNHWRVEREYGNSVAASHTAGASILGARDAWTSGNDEDQPDPFDEVLESLPIAISDVTGLQAALDGSAIELTDTDATTAQVSDVLNTSAKGSLGLVTRLGAVGTGDSLNAFCLSRIAGLPWFVLPAYESVPSAAMSPGAIISVPTVWPAYGTSGYGGVLETIWHDAWLGLLDETVIVAQPKGGGGASASVTTAMGVVIPAVPGSNAIKAVNINTGYADHGTFTVSYDGDTTAALAFDISQAAFIAALEALDSIGAGNVQTPVGYEAGTLTGDPGALYFEFIGDLAGQNLADPTIPADTTGTELFASELQLGGDGGTPEDFTPTPDADLIFTVHNGMEGDWGDALRVQFIDPGAADQPLRIESTDGWTIRILLETDNTGAIVTTAADVATLFAPADTNGFAPWPVKCELDGDGSGPLNATAALPLVGGSGDALGVTYTVTGSL